MLPFHLLYQALKYSFGLQVNFSSVQGELWYFLHFIYDWDFGAEVPTSITSNAHSRQACSRGTCPSKAYIHHTLPVPKMLKTGQPAKSIGMNSMLGQKVSLSVLYNTEYMENGLIPLGEQLFCLLQIELLSAEFDIGRAPLAAHEPLPLTLILASAYWVAQRYQHPAEAALPKHIHTVRAAGWCSPKLPSQALCTSFAARISSLHREQASRGCPQAHICQLMLQLSDSSQSLYVNLWHK